MGRTTAHDGQELYFESYGSGPTILAYVSPRPPRGPLGANSRRLAAAFRDNLADRFRVVLIDYPGTPKPDTLTPENVTSDLLSVADEVGAERFGWWGYSWGGVIGLQLALAAPDRLSALVCGGFPPLDGPYEAMLELSRAVAQKAESLPGIKVGLPAKMRNGARQFATYYEDLQDFDDRAAQSRLTCPRLCYVGGDDHTRIGSKEYCSISNIVGANRAELESLGWTVEIVPGLGHNKAMAADVFLQVAEPWLDEHLGAAR